MPYISEISIQNLRNLGSVKLLPSKNLNVITGVNGAGKTSILEAISYLSNGRSFRTNKFRNIIKEGEPQVILRGNVVQDDQEESVVALLRDRSGEFQIKQNHEKIGSASVLARNLPLLVLDNNSFDFFEGSPKDRRKLFDWLVFHVKHSFQDDWATILKCYKQRNSLLRSGKIRYSDLEPWDQQIAKHSLRLAKCRAEVFDSLHRYLIDTAISLNDNLDEKLTVEYAQGWKIAPHSEVSILDQLAKAFERDLNLGYSTLGPHKADIKVRVSNKPVQEILSRGQQKKLICALYLALIKVLEADKQRSAVLLADDLPAEFDQESLGLVLKQMSSANNQCFITAISKESVSTALSLEMNKCQMFHVKHGVLELTT